MILATSTTPETDTRAFEAGARGESSLLHWEEMIGITVGSYSEVAFFSLC